MRVAQGTHLSTNFFTDGSTMFIKNATQKNTRSNLEETALRFDLVFFISVGTTHLLAALKVSRHLRGAP